jgi:hypothetical protein
VGSFEGSVGGRPSGLGRTLKRPFPRETPLCDGIMNPRPLKPIQVEKPTSRPRDACQTFPLNARSSMEWIAPTTSLVNWCQWAPHVGRSGTKSLTNSCPWRSRAFPMRLLSAAENLRSVDTARAERCGDDGSHGSLPAPTWAPPEATLGGPPVRTGRSVRQVPRKGTARVPPPSASSAGPGRGSRSRRAR